MFNMEMFNNDYDNFGVEIEVTNKVQIMDFIYNVFTNITHQEAFICANMCNVDDHKLLINSNIALNRTCASLFAYDKAQKAVFIVKFDYNDLKIGKTECYINGRQYLGNSDIKSLDEFYNRFTRMFDLPKFKASMMVELNDTQFNCALYQPNEIIDYFKTTSNADISGFMEILTQLEEMQAYCENDEEMCLTYLYDYENSDNTFLNLETKFQEHSFLFDFNKMGLLDKVTYDAYCDYDLSTNGGFFETNNLNDLLTLLKRVDNSLELEFDDINDYFTF